MNYLSKDTQVTQTGTALTINTIASSALSSLFSPCLGPNGTLKMLISSSLTVSKDGTALSKEIQFTHPFSIIVTKSAINQAQMLGDGTISFIMLTCEIFNNAVRQKDTSLHKITSGIQVAMKDVQNYLFSVKQEMNEESISKIVYSSLITKISDARIFTDYITKAFANINNNGFLDTNMIEILKMPEGDVEESLYVEGLVLDHGPRHPLMPVYLEDCVILIASISLEYEKPEINAQFNYKSADQRDSLLASERKFIFERAEEIANFGKEIKKKTGKNMVLINEKGIDQISLEVLSNAGILALRRAKRRNLERLVKMCGGNIISRVEQLDFENLGYCEKTRVVSFGDEKFTFLEGTPFKGSCTILVKGNTSFEVERTVLALKSAIKSLSLLMREKIYLKGGVYLYSNLINHLNLKIKEIEINNVMGYKVLRDGLLCLAKTLLRNQDRNIEEEMIKIERNEYEDEGVVDNFSVVSRLIANACILTTNLLMVDDIIKAGKTIKEEKNEEK
ncbi:T-complex protein 1 subunit zeta [Gurleya vavrai]